MIRSWPLMAVICGTLALGCADTSRATTSSNSALEIGSFLDGAMPSRSQSWWSGFDDETMTELIGMARRHSASTSAARPLNAVPVEIGVAAAYVSLRVQAFSLTYLENARSAAARQLQLMIASNPEHDDFIKELVGRKTKADDAIRKIRAQREIHIAFLAAQCGMSEAALTDVIGAALADRTRTLPKFLAPVPSALPEALLANRDDVNLAAALYGIDSAAAFAYAIEATDASSGRSANDEAQAALLGHPLYLAIVAQARNEVSEALQRLQTQSDIANAAYNRMRDANAEFEAAKKRRDRGEMSEVQLMEDFLGLLQHLQMVAVANGDLAVAWIALFARLGNGTSIDGSSASRSALLDALPKVSQKTRDPRDSKEP